MKAGGSVPPLLFLFVVHVTITFGVYYLFGIWPSERKVNYTRGSVLITAVSLSLEQILVYLLFAAPSPRATVLILTGLVEFPVRVSGGPG